MLEEKGKELGRLIGQSPEYQALKRSSEALSQDREAVALLQQMEKLRGEAQQLLQRGEDPTPEMEQQLDNMLERIQAQPVYQRAVAAQENFDKLMLRVNEWMMDGMKKGAACLRPKSAPPIGSRLADSYRTSRCCSMSLLRKGWTARMRAGRATEWSARMMNSISASPTLSGNSPIPGGRARIRSADQSS
jgi:cell fate (sporulation/competence/biofilm development) regulator YlbF (YheA/YmcA/DUF963 family)